VRSGADAADRMRRLIAGAKDERFSRRALLWRLEQFLEESERIIPAAADALRSGDFDRLGLLVAESQWMAEEGLKNQVPQTVLLARAARAAGAVAASAFGAGFGGSAWALVPEADVEDFRRDWMTYYREAFPADAERASTFVTAAGPPAQTLPCPGGMV
jgi:galactokinase